MTTLILCVSRGGLPILHGGLYFHSLGVEMLKLKCQFPAEDFGHITCSKEQSDDHGHSVLTWQEVCYQNAFILKQKCSNKTQ